MSYEIDMELNYHDKQIFSKLNSHFKYIYKHYNAMNVFGIYYDEAEEKIYVSVIPTFEYISGENGYIDEELVENGRTYYIRDVRLITVKDSYIKYPEFFKSLSSKYVLINPRYGYIYDTMFNEKYDMIKKNLNNIENCEEIKKAVKEILRVCLLDNSTVVVFLKRLTDIEKIALEKVIETIGPEGIFNQAKLSSDVGISRLGMTNLMQKLEKFDIAEIQRLGRGGTYCRFKDLSIIDIAGTSNMVLR